jgi:hypothetical protein
MPLPPLGIVLVVLAFIPPVWAFVLFRREDTEINPTSPAYRKPIGIRDRSTSLLALF